MFSFYEYRVFCAGWPLPQNGTKYTKSKANNENEESNYCGEITWVWEFQDFLFEVHISPRKKAALFKKKWNIYLASSWKWSILSKYTEWLVISNVCNLYAPDILLTNSLFLQHNLQKLYIYENWKYSNHCFLSLGRVEGM